jgi:hypothetical protein
MAQWFKDSKGYRRFSDSGKSVHRWSAEKRIGRPLRNGEVVHHINRNKSDNRPSNLWVFKNQKAHDKTHRRDKKKFGLW